ncbi:MAG: MMPL family transporter [Bacteroidia bacterium]|nr:MMPL family transporter [Bacteroidia bacterium]
MERFLDILRRHFRTWAIACLIFYGLFLVVSVGYIITHLKFNYEMESFFPEGEEELDYYLEHLGLFESDHDILLVGLTNKGGLYDTTFLSKVNFFHDRLKTRTDVVKIFSPVRTVKYRMRNGVPSAIPFFHPGNVTKLLEDSIRIASTSHPVKNLLDVEGGTLCMVIKTRPHMGLDSTKVLCSEVEEELNKIGFDEYRLAGRTRAQVYIITSMQKEFFLLAGITILVVATFLFLTFRNRNGIVFPVITVLLGLVGTLDFALLFSDGIDIFSIIIPTVLFVVGVSDSVHILNNYYGEIGKGTEKTEALIRTIRDISFSTLLTAVTSAVGFITLVTITIKPIAWFGINAAFGIMLVYFISFTFLIPVLYFLKPFAIPPSDELVKPSVLSRLYNWVGRRGTHLAVLFLITLIPVGYGVSRIQANSYFTEELREGDPYKEDFGYFDKHLGGVRPFEMSVKITKPGGSVFDADIQKQIEKVSSYLRKVYGVGGISDPSQPVKAVHQMLQNGAEDAFCLPPDSLFPSVQAHLISLLDRPEFRALVTEDMKNGRIAGRLSDLGAIEVKKRNEALYEFISQHCDPSQVRFRVTGISTVLDSNNNFLTRNLMEGLIYELLTIGLLMAFLFRSLRMMIISLLPNLFPLVFIGGLLGWLEINLNLSSSIIFNIAFGITVDDTIHLLSGYKLYLRKGFEKKEAIRLSFLHSGKAVTMTSFILFGGFAVLLLSGFNGIFHTGLLVGATLIVALLSDLLLLPNLVKWMHR